MPHQHHFLSRLDRIAAPQVELALDLYRDHQLLRFLLDSARIPEGAPRVAISLDHPERGPFLVVTREGRFVTCLAEGMTVGDLPIITRERLDGIAAKHAELRVRFELRRRLAGRSGGTGRLLARLYDAGEELAREEFVAIAIMQPLLRDELAQLQKDTSDGLFDARNTLLRHFQRTDRPKEHIMQLLEAYYRSSWASAHLILLVGMEGRENLQSMNPEVVQSAGTFFSFSQFHHYVVGPAARGIWTAGKIGKLILPSYKRAYAEATMVMKLIESALGLAVLGLRHAKLGAEVRKALSAFPVGFGRDPAAGETYLLVKQLVEITEMAFEHPEIGLHFQRKVGSALAVARTRALPASSSFRFTRPEDVPEDLAMTLAVNANEQFLMNLGLAGHLFFFLPWLGKAAPESFFAPADFILATRRPWSPKQAMPLLEGRLANQQQRGQEPRSKEPTKNGPCPCGSGKKHKRCCGEERG